MTIRQLTEASFLFYLFCSLLFIIITKLQINLLASLSEICTSVGLLIVSLGFLCLFFGAVTDTSRTQSSVA